VPPDPRCRGVFSTSLSDGSAMAKLASPGRGSAGVAPDSRVNADYPTTFRAFNRATTGAANSAPLLIAEATF
jgi:hypothetical protein